jgi:hypothetical protein
MKKKNPAETPEPSAEGMTINVRDGGQYIIRDGTEYLVVDENTEVKNEPE